MDYSIKKVVGEIGNIRRTSIQTEDGETISIALILPNSPTTKVFVIVPGFGVDKENSSKNLLIPLFLSSKVACLTFDLFGHGQSSGNVIDLTVSKIINEVNAVVYYLINHKFKDISIYASSLPALGVSLALSKFNLEVKRFLLQSPLFDISDYVNDQGKIKWRESGYIIHDSYIGKVKFGYKYYLDAIKYKNATKYLPSIKAKTLVLLGSKDEYLPIRKVSKTVEAIPKLEKTIIFPNSDHVISQEKEKLYNTIYKFVVK